MTLVKAKTLSQSQIEIILFVQQSRLFTKSLFFQKPYGLPCEHMQ